MLRFAYLLLLGALASASAFAAPAAFEGRIKMAVKDGRQTQTIEYAVKPDFMRMEIPLAQGGNAVSIINLAQQEMIILMPGQAMYMVMPLEQANQQVQKMRDRSDGTFEETNETVTILGYRCTKYVYTDQDGPTEIWAAEGFGAFVGLGAASPANAAPGNRWEQELVKKGAFPLRVVGRNKSGKERFHLEAVSIEPQMLPDALFKVPPGYQLFSMAGMMKSLLPGPGGR
jgi:hypothetical protein